MVQFSVLFKGKLRSTLAMVLLCFLFMGTVIEAEWVGDYNQLNLCISKFAPDVLDQKALATTYIIVKCSLHALAWILSYYLLICQYRKGLSETWYAHKTFWYLKIIADGTLIAYCSVIHKYYISIVIRGLFAAQILNNLVLIALLLNTKERTLERPRPDILITKDGEFIEQLENGQSRTTSFGNYGDHRGSIAASKLMIRQSLQKEPKI